MAVTIQYRHGSVRARKARAAKRFGKHTATIEYSLIGVITAASLYLLATHHASGRSLAGVGLLVVMITLWQRWDIGDLDAAAKGLNTEVVQLDRVVESNLLASLSSTITAKELWTNSYHEWGGVFMLQRLGVPPTIIGDMLNQAQVPTETIWQAAVARAQAVGAPQIDSGIVIAATLSDIPAIQPVIASLKLTNDDIMSVLSWQQRVALKMQQAKTKPYYGGVGRDWASGYTPLLDQFSEDLSVAVERGYQRELPTVHQVAADQIIQSLNENRGVALVGGIGSGRTAIAYSVAERLLANQRVGDLSYYRLRSLDASSLITADGQVEATVNQLLVEAVHAKNTIIFLDEAHLFLSTGVGAVNLASLLLPILQRNVIKMVLAMTEHDWQDLVATQPGVASSLQRVTIAEPQPAETAAILQDEAITIEYKAKTTIRQDAISEAVKLATRYMPETALPGKAITVLESAAHYPEEHFVTAESVRQAITATTGAKVTSASAPEKKQLLKLEDQIHQRMINQTRAVSVVADALRRSRAGVASSKRPVGSFLFLGPTGVGKTELAKSLAAVYFGGEQAVIRLDMSEYQQQSDVSRLLAPGSGSETGSSLLGNIRQNPSTVVLLDEIEKGHPDILNLLLQLLDEGRLTDSNGRAVSFRDAIIIATSNACADDIRDHIQKGERLEDFEPAITEQLIKSHQFKPELLNRFDEIVLFRPLTKDELGQVVGLMMADVNTTLADQNVSVELTPAAAAWLVEHGYDPALGTRPLRRMVQRTVENIVAEKLLGGSVTAGQKLTLDAPDLATQAQAKK